MAVVPVSDIKELLDEFWDESNLDKPQLIEANHEDSTMTITLANNGPAVIVRSGFPAIRETPIGNWTYGDREYSVLLDIYTIKSRQELYDIAGEIRKICHARMHEMDNFQRIRFVSFEEVQDEQAEKYWQGQIEITLVNTILLETS